MEITLSKWYEYIDSKLSWEKGELDCSSYHAFMRAGSLGIASQLALEEVASRIRLAGDHPKETKLKSQITRAYQYASQDAAKAENLRLARPKPKPVFQPDKLERVAQELDCEVTDEWLAARSPVTPWNRSPAGILHKLFRVGEKVLVFDVYESQGQVLWEHPGACGDLAALDRFKTGCWGAWFLNQPTSGQELFNPRQNKPSRRSEESVTAWRYAVLESDRAPRDLWLRALVQLPLPVSAITDSAGSSVHALVRVDSGSKTEWDEIVRGRWLPILTILGADPGALTAVRLTRLGNCERVEKRKLQRLLYLDPEPDGTPIHHKLVREAPGGAAERFQRSWLELSPELREKEECYVG